MSNLDWTDKELAELDAFRMRVAGHRAVQAVFLGLAIVVAMRAGILPALLAYGAAMLIAHIGRPIMPDHLIERARQIDKARARLQFGMVD